MLRTAVKASVGHTADLTDAAVAEGLGVALERFSEHPLPPGPYGDTAAPGGGSFLDGRPLDPARIPRVLAAFAQTWVGHPQLCLGDLLDLALDRAGIRTTRSALAGC